MKKRNLFLSLISSILVAVAIVTVTIVSVVQPNKKNADNGANVDVVSDINNEKDYDYINEFERNGSRELPYILYSAESMDLLSAKGAEDRPVTRLVKETKVEGDEVVVVDKLDEEGHKVFEPVLDENGHQLMDVYHFELVNDIDFAGTPFVTLFNGKAFKGQIHGNGYAFKNISINVTDDNFVSQFSYTVEGKKYAHVAVFGDINGAVIEDVNFENLSVNVEEGIYNNISNHDYGTFQELVVGSVAGIANNSTIKNVKINASVAGSAYSLEGNNAIGGVAAIANNVKVENSKVNVKVSANSGARYHVGGIAGYGRVAEVKNTEVVVEIESSCSRLLKMGGLYSYASSADIENVQVTLNVKETNPELRSSYVAGLNAKEKVDASSLNEIGGLVHWVEANDSTQKSSFTNVTVASNVDFDCIFAGAVCDVLSSNPSTKTLVQFKDVVVASKVNALAVHGFARQLIASTVSYSEDKIAAEGYFNIRIDGDVKLSKYYVNDTRFVAATLVSATKIAYYSVNYSQLYFEVSSQITSKLPEVSVLSINNNQFASYKTI